MADVEQSVVAVLAGIAGGRITPNRIDQAATLPAIAYQSTRKPFNTIHGPAIATEVVMTLIVAAATFAEARTVAEQVRAAIQAATSLAAIPGEEQGDEFDPDTRLHLYSLTYTLWQA